MEEGSSRVAPELVGQVAKSRIADPGDDVPAGRARPAIGDDPAGVNAVAPSSTAGPGERDARARLEWSAPTPFDGNTLPAATAGDDDEDEVARSRLGLYAALGALTLLGLAGLVWGLSGGSNATLHPVARVTQGPQPALVLDASAGVAESAAAAAKLLPAVPVRFQNLALFEQLADVRGHDPVPRVRPNRVNDE